MASAPAAAVEPASDIRHQPALDGLRGLAIAGVVAFHAGLDHMLYHMVMARRQVLVQLEDELVDRLDELAEAEGVSRSELLRRGASAVLDAAEQGDADRTLRDAYRRVPQDPALIESAQRLAARTTPEW